jgi:hypothetical protein
MKLKEPVMTGWEPGGQDLRQDDPQVGNSLPECTSILNNMWGGRLYHKVSNPKDISDITYIHSHQIQYFIESQMSKSSWTSESSTAAWTFQTLLAYIINHTMGFKRPGRHGRHSYNVIGVPQTLVLMGIKDTIAITDMMDSTVLRDITAIKNRITDSEICYVENSGL